MRATVAAIVLAVVLSPFGLRAWSYCTLPSSWPGGQITMSYNLGPSGQLINGTTSWAQNAESAMSEWSSVSSSFRFISGGDSGAGGGSNDGINNIIFADRAGGDPFEEDVLALTLTRTVRPGESSESDIILNRDVQWNAYDGPLRVSNDGTAIFDVRRVLLHELGHVLGLAHPDDTCDQTLDAVMNAQTSDTDRLTTDDRNGLSFIYAGGNVPPIANAGPDKFGVGTDPILLNGGGSSDSDGSIISYDWFLNGDLIARGRVVEIDLRRGEYDIELIVSDNDGASSSDRVMVFIGSEFIPPLPGNDRPTANAGGDTTVQSGRIILLDGSASIDPDGEIDRYVWALGNTVLGRDVTLRVSLPQGVHEITLTVFDDRGDADTDSVLVTVTDSETTETPDVAPPVVVTPPAQQEPVDGAVPCGATGLVPLVAMLIFPSFAKRRLRTVA